MAKRQTTLLSTWTVPAKVRKEGSSILGSSNEEQAGLSRTADSELEYEGDLSELSESDEPEMEHVSTSDTVPTSCTAICCSSSEKAFQPTERYPG